MRKHIGFWAAFGAMAASSCSNSSGPDLSAHVEANILGFVTIKNNDKFDWKDCQIALNAHRFSGGYSASEPLVRHGKEIVLYAAQFADDDGTRFDPGRQLVKAITIECDTPLGRGNYSGSRN